MAFLSWLRSRTSIRPPRGRAQHRPAAARFRPQLEALEGRDVPSTFTVTSLADSGPGTLRAGVASSADTITFAPGLHGTITLASEIAITANLTIHGPGANQLTVSGNDATRVFDVSGSAPVVTIDNLTVAHGKASGDTLQSPPGFPVTLAGAHDHFRRIQIRR